MNILYLHTHDTGRYIEPYGHAVPTPSLMELARGGTIFRNAHAAAPTCSPSRAAMLTGTSPHSCGMLGLAHRGFQLHDYGRHLARVLGAHGWETVLCGIQHEAPRAEMIGYSRILGEQGYVMRELMKDPNFSSAAWDLANADRVCAYIRSAGSGPFFISYGMFNTHREFPKEPFPVDPDYVSVPPEIADTRANRADMAAFIGSAAIVDRCVGRVLDALREAGRDRETLVIFTTDHGIPFPESKSALYDTGTGVALILRYPGNSAAGQAVDALVSQLDLFPTICDLAGIPRPDWLQGHSLVPVLRGDKEEVRDELFAEVTFHSAYEPLRSVRTRRYKLVVRYGDDLRFTPANVDDCPSKKLLIESGYRERRPDRIMLFDLYLDPLERVNRAADPDYAAVLQDLTRRLEGWMRETDDPLLRGPVPRPPGARINKASCLSSLEDDFE
jgi:N-sulfoglucosamine sulfohydrolase